MRVVSTSAAVSGGGDGGGVFLRRGFGDLGYEIEVAEKVERARGVEAPEIEESESVDIFPAGRSSGR